MGAGRIGMPPTATPTDVSKSPFFKPHLQRLTGLTPCFDLPERNFQRSQTRCCGRLGVRQP